MKVIGTNLKRKILRYAASGAAAVAFPAAAATALILHPDVLPDKKNDMLYTESDVVNSDSFVLYTPEIPEPQPETSVTEENSEVPQDDNAQQVRQFSAITADRYLLTVNRSTENEDVSAFTTHSGKIIEETFGKGNGAEFISLNGYAQIRNHTDIPAERVEAECAVPSNISVELFSDEPQVLIVHTHTTESYEPYEKDWYDESYTCRSSDPDNGVVAVGDAIAKELAAAGICVVHDCTVHDGVYSGAYSRSLSTTIDELDRYPSVKVVLDIHRDAIAYNDGSRVSAVTDIDGRKAAQLMVICAADDGTYGVPDFFDNLHFACELQSETETMFPTLTRPVLFQYCQYNQQVSKGALLVEVGSHGNTVEQAVYSGELLGKSLASLLTKKAQPIEAVPVLANVPLYFVDRVM